MSSCKKRGNLSSRRISLKKIQESYILSSGKVVLFVVSWLLLDHSVFAWDLARSVRVLYLGNFFFLQVISHPILCQTQWQCSHCPGMSCSSSALWHVSSFNIHSSLYLFLAVLGLSCGMQEPCCGIQILCCNTQTSLVVTPRVNGRPSRA